MHLNQINTFNSSARNFNKVTLGAVPTESQRMRLKLNFFLKKTWCRTLKRSKTY